MPNAWPRCALILSLLVAVRLPAQRTAAAPQHPLVYYSDTSRIGRPFAKDPSVIEFRGTYFMYYSVPPGSGSGKGDHGEQTGWGIGIATSHDLLHWTKAGEVTPEQPVERNGIAAPGARVIRGQVHIFYQTYGGGARDAICHATSNDGIHFTHDPSNPVYRPTHMPWSAGRAIDAEIYLNQAKGKAYLYFATRDPSMRRQMLALAQADLKSNFSAGTWSDISTTGPLLAPELPWEGLCIEAPTVMRRGSEMYLFYAGAYNNSPQQVGLATSSDGISWKRSSQQPFLRNGAPGTWNSSESGHPGVLNTHGKTYLFYQGNDDHGKTYWISMVRILWKHGSPVIAAP
jgi:predicted GH43/DUF377 family glycosyl hydrolase